MSEQPLHDSSRAEDVREFGALTMRSTRAGADHVIALSGELDLATAEIVDAELQRVEAGDARAIVVDLSELTFIDSSGVRLIYTADVRSRQDSDRLVIRRGPAKVQRIFVMTDLESRLPFVD
jgi:anti-anti-sigma factor